MLEEALLQLLFLSLTINIAFAIISFILTIIIALKIYKENHTSARY